MNTGNTKEEFLKQINETLEISETWVDLVKEYPELGFPMIKALFNKDYGPIYLLFQNFDKPQNYSNNFLLYNTLLKVVEGDSAKENIDLLESDNSTQWLLKIFKDPQIALGTNSGFKLRQKIRNKGEKVVLYNEKESLLNLLHNCIIKIVNELHEKCDSKNPEKYEFKEKPTVVSSPLGEQALRTIKSILKRKQFLDYHCALNKALYFAVQQQSYDEKTIGELLKAGADINAENFHGRTPLHAAVSRRDLDIVEFLKTNGADVNVQDSLGRTPLHAAVSRGNVEIIKFLIANGADVNAEDSHGRTPIHYSISKANKELFELFLRKLSEEEINAQYNHGNTLLHTAISFYQRIILCEKEFPKEIEKIKDIIKLLMECGASLDVKNDDGHTPLDLAASKNPDLLTPFLKELQETFLTGVSVSKVGPLTQKVG